jgi:glycosyltransferase involved in cell wall biosynthesis
MTAETEREPVTVSVIIPTRNRRELLLRAVRSVLRQRDVTLSVVVVDEASTDGSAEALHSLADPRVHVVRHESPRGVSQARNTGLQQVESPWVAFLDDDDLWAPDKLSAQLEALRQQPRAQWACTGAVNVDSRCQILNVSYPPCDPDVSGPLLTLNVVPGGGSGVLVATALARQVGGFDDALANLADWDFYIRLSLQSPVAAVQAPLVGYHVHAAGMAHDIERSSREIGCSLPVTAGRARCGPSPAPSCPAGSTPPLSAAPWPRCPPTSCSRHAPGWRRTSRKPALTLPEEHYGPSEASRSD